MAAPVAVPLPGPGNGGSGPSSAWTRRYPPLAALAVAFLIALAILPSSLNLPQSSPSTVLEYAPVPPEQEEDVPPSGNVSQFGLGSSTGLQGGGATGGEGAGGAPPPPPPPAASQGPLSGGTPRTKRCVGSPPRQTEDPLSPPCVAHFDGDNGGATYQGVKRDEVRIIIYAEGNTAYTGSSRGREVTPDGQYFDLAEPADPDEHLVVRALRLYQQYFNDRYQTYGRFVHFWVFFGTGGANASPETRRADAADNFATVKPFAAMNFATEHTDAYLEAMARKGVLNFGSFFGRDAQFFQRYPKLIWGLLPSLEQQSKIYSSYVCQKVKPSPVSFSGNATDNGKARKYALLYTTDPGREDLRRFKDLAVEQMKACGVTFEQTYTYPYAGFTHDTRATPRYAAEAMADAQRRGITTLIWPGGIETNFSKAGANIGYLPEVVIAGDGDIESEGFDDDQHPAFWDHTAIVTNQVYAGRLEEEFCFQAAREANPDEPRVDIGFVHCRFYADIRQLFIGIQVAGPRLGPTSIDKGFHAIPRVPSTNPRIPACFYDPGDYTCTKDGAAEHYDSTGDTPEDTSIDGCYRMAENGKRYIAGQWPGGNVNAQWRPDDICNEYSNGSGTYLNPGTPEE